MKFADQFKTSLNALKERLRPRFKSILAIATDGCTATGAVVRCVDGTRLEIEALASSRALKFDAMAEEIVAALKAQGASIPKQAVLLTAAMLPAVLELPVAANKPLPAERMLEMLRWELEPLFVQHAGLWSLGSLLFGRGYLSGAQRRELLEAQAASRAQKGRLGSARFGELAIARGFVKREQMEECLALQEELQTADADMLIGWHSAPVGSRADSGQSAWLCAGLNPAIRTRWIEALEGVGLHVLWIYPLAGASAPLAALSGWPVALEWHTLFGACYRQKEGALAQFRYCQFAGASLPADDVSALAGPLFKPGDPLPGIFPGRDWEPALAEALQTEVPREQSAGSGMIGLADCAMLLPPAHNGIPEAVLAALAGGAAHVLGLAPAASAVRLPGSRPPPPVYRRPAAWASVAAALLLSGIGAFEANNYFAQRSLLAQQQELFARQAELEAAKSEIELSVRAEQEAVKSLEAAQAELKNIELRKQLYERAFGRRSRFMETLLGALTVRIGDELLLKEVTETAWQQIELQGFALNVEAVYRYARALADDLKDFGVKLGDLDTSEAPGPLGLMGHRFSFVLLQDAKGEAPR